MTLPVHRAQIEEFVAHRIALLMLCKDVLQCQRKIAKPSSLRPLAVALVLFCQSDIRKQPAASTGAFLETRG